METLDDYAARVERGAFAALALAAHQLRMNGSPMSLLAAHQLELIRSHIDLDGLLDEALDADGLDVFTDQRDGLRYVRPQAVAA